MPPDRCARRIAQARGARIDRHGRRRSDTTCAISSGRQAVRDVGASQESPSTSMQSTESRSTPSSCCSCRTRQTAIGLARSPASRASSETQRSWRLVRRARDGVEIYRTLISAARCTASRVSAASAARASIELYTCRYCGTAYARAYTDDVDSPSALWSEPGRGCAWRAARQARFCRSTCFWRSQVPARPVEPADYDLETGRLNPNEHGPRMRTVYLRHDRTTPPVDEDGDVDQSLEARGQFIPCACCGKIARFGAHDCSGSSDQGRSAVSGACREADPDPAARMPSSQRRFAPLRGRKVLVFSDSRQVAARLAPNLQMYSTRDSLRPLIAWGYTQTPAGQRPEAPCSSLETSISRFCWHQRNSTCVCGRN